MNFDQPRAEEDFQPPRSRLEDLLAQARAKLGIIEGEKLSTNGEAEREEEARLAQTAESQRRYSEQLEEEKRREARAIEAIQEFAEPFWTLREDLIETEQVTRAELEYFVLSDNKKAYETLVAQEPKKEQALALLGDKILDVYRKAGGKEERPQIANPKQKNTYVAVLGTEFYESEERKNRIRPFEELRSEMLSRAEESAIFRSSNVISISKRLEEDAPVNSPGDALDKIEKGIASADEGSRWYTSRDDYTIGKLQGFAIAAIENGDIPIGARAIACLRRLKADMYPEVVARFGKVLESMSEDEKKHFLETL